MRIVVTGAASFIGLAVTGELLAMGHEVYAVVRPDSPGKGKLGKRKGLFILPCTLQDIGSLTGQVQLREGADAWLHLGWEGAGSANRQDAQVQALNIAYALKALETAHALGCTRFLFSGSQAEYGIYHTVMKEDGECNPVSEYGKDKLKVCAMASREAKRLGITYIHTRIFSVYGPGDHPWSLISTCMDTFKKGGHMELGTCTQMWNFLYITDAARALTGLLLAKASAGVYNVAGEDTRPLREYIEELHRLCGGEGTYEYGKHPPNAEGVVSLIPDIKKLCEASGFRQEVSFGRGIREMLTISSKEADT